MKNSNVMCQPLFRPFVFQFITVREGTVETRTHSFAEFFLVREGAVRMNLDGEEKTLRAGEAVIICPGAAHRLSPCGDEETRGILVRLDPDRIPAFPDYSPGLRAILSEARKQRMPMELSPEEVEALSLRDLMTGCGEEARARRFGYDLEITLRLSAACLRVCRFWLGRGLVLPERNVQPLSIDSLAGYIQDHLQDGLRVEDLAEKCGLSYPWFAKKFRDLYGIGCKEYIEQIRVSRVEQFLRFTDMDLNRISEATGYADCSHMIKNFKRLMGMTPGQFRQSQARQDPERR